MKQGGINFKRHMDVWSGKQEDYSNLKVFGYLAFGHIKYLYYRIHIDLRIIVPIIKFKVF